MKKEKLSIFENMIWNTIGSFTYLVCQWLLTLIVVRISSDMENAGNLALAISITNIFFSLANFNVRPYLVSDLKNKYIHGMYCHSEFLGQKVREVEDFSYGNLKLNEIVGETKYPAPQK